MTSIGQVVNFFSQDRQGKKRKIIAIEKKLFHIMCNEYRFSTSGDEPLMGVQNNRENVLK